MAERKSRRGHRDRQRKRSTDSGNRIRVRGKRLDQVDDTKLAMAYWLLAQQLAEDKTDPRQLTEEEVRKVAKQLEDEERGSITGRTQQGGGAS